MSNEINCGDFENASVAAARTFGRKGEVNVVFTGQSAMTDGNTIYIPALDQTKTIDETTARVTRGFIDHEAGHLRHTDMAAFTTEMEAAKKRGDKFFGMLLNCIEDVRIEDCVRSEYLGADRNISTMNEKLADSVIERLRSVDASDVRVTLPIAIIAADMERTSVSSEKSRALCEALPADIMELARESLKLVDELPRVVEREQDGMMVRDGKPGTKQAIDLAKLITKKAKEFDEKQRGRTPPPTGEGDGENKEPGEGEGPEGGPNLEGDVRDDINSWLEKAPEPVSNAVDLRKVLHRVVGKSRRGYTRYSTRSDKIHTTSDPKDKYVDHMGEDYTYGRSRMSRSTGRSTYRKVLTNNPGSVGVMARKLERALMDKLRRGWQRNLEDGGFDNRRIIGAVRGEPNIYKMRDDAPSLDTAVQLVIDLSGSMSGRKVNVAMQSTICLVEALNRVGVATEVVGFNDCGGWLNKADYNGAYAARATYTRVDPIDFYVFKDFDERLRDAQLALGNIIHCATGNNSDGEAIVHAYGRLAKRSEKKKVMLVLSDGSPATNTHDHDGLCTHLRMTVDMVERKGVKTIGIGICDDSVSRFYPRYTVIESVADLGKATLDQIGRMILGERFKVDNSDLLDARRSA